jgi:hypothetical protein
MLEFFAMTSPSRDVLVQEYLKAGDMVCSLTMTTYSLQAKSTGSVLF